jgi:signal transduction histidine kinase
MKAGRIWASLRARLGTKLALVAGFGGVLALMALAGADSIHALSRIQAENARITASYIARQHALDEIRSSVYLLGTLVRDHILERNPEAAQAALDQLQALRASIDGELNWYAASLPEGARASVADLRTAMAGYWNTLDPVFQWKAWERRAAGRRFLETEVLPRRKQLLEIADRVAAVNERGLVSGRAETESLFDGLRLRIAGILGLALLAGIVLAGASIRHTLRLDSEAQRRYEEARRAQEELKRLSARLVEAQEDERRSIARELHDEIGQSLNALLLDLGQLAAAVPADGETGRLIGTSRALAERCVKEVRNMSLLLRPSMLDDFGLVPALHWQAREVSRRTKMRVQVVARGVSDDLPDGHKTCVYRIVQEALENAARHAGARSVKIRVLEENGRIELSVQDDGRGFNTAHVRGLGLIGMEERAKNLGGTFQVQSRPGQGTLLIAELPAAGAACTSGAGA